MAVEAIDDAVAATIAGLTLDANRPLIISDADEVLFAFMAAFEAFLIANEHYFDWSSFALDGNVRRKADSEPVERPQVLAMLGQFFADHTETIAPVPEAASSLDRLSDRAQIVVLSNIPADQATARSAALRRHGMAYPLIASSGPKGPAVSALAARAGTPVFFIDDGPNHHRSVARHANHVRRIHMIADERLARLIDQAPDSDHRADDWPTLRALIESELSEHGF
ncbi:MAG: hypothetical protein VCC99_02545 [Alphaproteobacteria bacterium]